MKTCNKCGESKPLEAYVKRKVSPDGLAYVCKECSKAFQTEYYEDNREKFKEYAKRYRKENPAKVNAVNSRWIANNPEKRFNIEKKYKDAHPETRRGIAHRYRTQKANNDSNLVRDVELAAIAAMPCTACGAAGPSEIDHIIPVTRGGAHTIGNFMPLCRSCNASKNDLLYIEWKYSARPQALKVFAA